MSREQSRGAVELLAQHHLRERVRQRQRREPQQQGGLALERRVQSVGAADDERGRLIEQRRELARGQVLAALVEGDKAGFLRNPYSRGLDLQQRNLIALRHAPQIFVARAACPRGQITCDGDELEPCHAASPSSSPWPSAWSLQRASLPCRPRALPGCSSCAPRGA